MLFGSLPIIPFVVACTLTGCFLMKQEESPALEGLSSVLLAVTAVVGVFYMLTATYSVQKVMEEERSRLEVPRHEDVELDWLQHRQAMGNKEVARCLHWEQFPFWVQVVLSFGGVANVTGTLIFLTMDKECFEDVSINTKLNAEMVQSFVKPTGQTALILHLVGVGSLILYSMWHSAASRSICEPVFRRLDKEAMDWKQERLAYCLEQEWALQRAEMLKQDEQQFRHAPISAKQAANFARTAP